MKEKYTNSIIDTTLQMVYDLQYLGNNNKKTLKDLNTLKVLNIIYQWADWYHISEKDKVKVENLMNSLILNNSNLSLPTITPNLNYSSASIPENAKVWERVYDDPKSVTWELSEDQESELFSGYFVPEEGTYVLNYNDSVVDVEFTDGKLIIEWE